MKIAVLGTGDVGRAVAGGLARVGHDVTVGTRDVADTAGREGYAAWAAEHPDIGLATFAEAAGDAELVVNAAGGDVCLGILDSAGADNLAGKVLLDISNPLDGSAGFPPTLFRQGRRLARRDDPASAPRGARGQEPQHAQQLAHGRPPAARRGHDGVRLRRRRGGQGHRHRPLRQLGHGDVIDLGGIETARGPEMWLPLWIRLNLALGGNDFNLKIVRGPSLRPGLRG